MTTDDVIDVLATAMRTLANGGIVCSGTLAFISPATPGLVNAEVRFVKSPVPTMFVVVTRTRRRESGGCG